MARGSLDCPSPFIASRRTLVAVEVSLGPTLQSGIPKPQFEAGVTAISERYAVGHDGKRFLVPMLIESTQSRPATVVSNWFAVAKR